MLRLVSMGCIGSVALLVDRYARMCYQVTDVNNTFFDFGMYMKVGYSLWAAFYLIAPEVAA